jgi:hypothetical protein
VGGTLACEPIQQGNRMNGYQPKFAEQLMAILNEMNTLPAATGFFS